MITETDKPWELDNAGNKDYAKNLMTGVSLEDMADATTAKRSCEISDGTDKSTLLKVRVKQSIARNNLLKSHHFQSRLSSMKRLSPWLRISFKIFAGFARLKNHF